MEIAENIRKLSFKRFLRRGVAFRLKGDIPFESDCYHVFVVLNYDVDTGDVLFLVNGASQLEKRWRALEDIEKIDAKSTTVYVKAGTYSFLPRDTLFDCNSVHCVNINDLDLDNIKMIAKGALTKEDVDRLINGALSSTMVERFIKKAIRPSGSNEQEGA